MFQNHVNKVIPFFRDRLTAKMNAAGRAGMSVAQNRAPVRTGFLRSSIGYTYRQSDMTLQLYADAPYAYFVESGTRWMAARPFLRPALNEVAKEFGSNVNLELGFHNTPSLKGKSEGPFASQAKTNREFANAKRREAVQQHNRAQTLKHDKGAAGRAKVRIGREHWNGPKEPWRRTWTGRPGKP